MGGIQLSNHLPFLCCGMGIIIKALTLHTSEKRVGGESALSTADVVITNGQGRRTGLSSHCVKAGAMYGEGDTPQAHHLATCYLIFFFWAIPNGAWSLLKALHSRIIPGRFSELSNWGSNPGWPCKRKFPNHSIIFQSPNMLFLDQT